MAKGEIFEQVPGARFSVERRAGVEHFVIPARRNWFMLLFLSLWLVGWSLGFVSAFSEVAHGSGDLFLIVWLTGWTIGGGFVVTTILWQLGGKEYLAVDSGGLLHGWRMVGIGRERRYDLSYMSNLRVSEAGMPWGNFARPSFPPIFANGWGTIRWNYGARTVSAAMGMSEAESEMIVARLSARLPAANR